MLDRDMLGKLFWYVVVPTTAKRYYMAVEI